MSKTSKLLALISLTGLSGGALAELPASGSHKHLGVATCATAQCHGSAVPRDVSDVLQNEYVTWTQDDPHARAYRTLTSDASRAMAQRLGYASATHAGICLDCHADNAPAAARGDKFQLSDGVGCEACHGGAENWLATHDNKPAVDYAANVAAGMYDTADVGARAELCLSCHLGTRDKFAAHRIMAAGHPRLTFELDTFGELWRTAGRQPHYRIDADYRARKPVASHVWTWATGLLADADRRMELVLDDSFDDGKMFPELGLYDCHACHRSMKSVQWQRLPRHGSAGPGVPFLSDGSLVMTMALARTVGKRLGKDLEVGLTRLHEAGSRDVGSIRAAARDIRGTLRELGQAMTAERVESRRGDLLRELLAMGADGNYLDYASAEQAFMAVQMLAFDLGDTGLRDRLQRLGDSLDDDERYRPARFQALLSELDD